MDFSYVEAIRTLEKNLAIPRHRHRNWRQKGCLQLFCESESPIKSNYRAGLNKVVPRLRELFRQVEAEVVSKSRNEIH